MVLEDDVWLGTRVTVLRGVRIGRGSIIGAGSVVAKDIPPYSVAQGVPAQVVGTLDAQRFVSGRERKARARYGEPASRR